MAAPAKAKSVRPPDKGSFPLDHYGECKPQMQAFLQCLKAHNQDHLPCKPLSKEYLACRMDRNLMAQEGFDKLGFSDDDAEYGRIRQKAVNEEGKKEDEGFVGGTHVRRRWKSWFG